MGHVGQAGSGKRARAVLRVWDEGKGIGMADHGAHPLGLGDKGHGVLWVWDERGGSRTCGRLAEQWRRRCVGLLWVLRVWDERGGSRT